MFGYGLVGFSSIENVRCLLLGLVVMLWMVLCSLGRLVKGLK